MSTNNLEKISSVCTTPKELITSDDFIKGLEIILEQVKVFDKGYILLLFTKLKNDEVLLKKEKEGILNFVRDEKVEKKLQELLSKLKSVSVNVKLANSIELASFTTILNNIFTEEGYKKIQGYICEVADISKLTLNTFEGMDEIVLNSLGGKKIYVKLFIEVNDTTLTHELSNGAKSNFPESEISYNPELITRNKRGHYHFGHTAANNRLKELGMRFLTKEERDSPELNKYIVEKLGSNMENFPGYRNPDGNDFSSVENYAYFWGGIIDSNLAYSLDFSRGIYKFECCYEHKTMGFCLLGVKD